MGHLKSIVISCVCYLGCVLDDTVHVASKPEEHNCDIDSKGAQMLPMELPKSRVISCVCYLESVWHHTVHVASKPKAHN